MQAQHLFPLIMVVQSTTTHITPTYCHLTKQSLFKAKTHTTKSVTSIHQRGEKKVPKSVTTTSTSLTSLRRGPHNWHTEGYACPRPNSLVQYILYYFIFGMRNTFKVMT